MAFSIMENLRGFFNSRPPLVVFMICLASFAITLITFAYIVKSRDFPDPDVTEDWNTFLEKFSHLQFCVSHDASSKNTSALPKLGLEEKVAAHVYQDIHSKLGQTLGVSDTDKVMVTGSNAVNQRRKRDNTDYSDSIVSSKSPVISNLDRETIPSSDTRPAFSKKQLENVTVSLNFVYIPSPDAKLSLNYGQFVAAVTAHMLKLDVSAKSISDEQLSIFLSFPQNLTQRDCEEEKDGKCLLYHVSGCITFQGSSLVLPQTQRPSQDSCPAHTEPTLDVALRTARAGTLAESSSRNWCIDGSRLMPRYTLDDSLTVFLSLHDKSVINLHLMRTSYFLFVMVVTLFCYAIVKGRQAKVKSVHPGYDKVSLHA